MFGLAQRTKTSSRCSGGGEAFNPGILIVTADIGFYAGVLNAACSLGWSAEWAISMNRGLAICRAEPIHIVIYDSNLPRVDLRCALDLLSAREPCPRILVASSQVDEELWCMVLRKHGYDVIKRSASSEQLRRELRFAWLSLRRQMCGSLEEAIG